MSPNRGSGGTAGSVRRSPGLAAAVGALGAATGATASPSGSTARSIRWAGSAVRV
ncbi:hypothetical protein [Spongiactinospora sp. TRM90649]|uniref:hypothetical protein n=1 Tax=Spongiactinospora sp. TRM90649 TaxID=3031114 RepID=UPI0023F86436|nr:hypothetical protein [Spongiactinospora sp. TRM90649]